MNDEAGLAVLWGWGEGQECQSQRRHRRMLGDLAVRKQRAGDQGTRMRREKKQEREVQEGLCESPCRVWTLS